MSTSREGFETWAKARSLPLDRLTNGEYAGYQGHTAWLAWSARDAELAALRAGAERLTAERDDFMRRWEDARAFSDSTISLGRYPGGSKAW